VIGHVLTCIQHTNADKLKVTTVDIGTGSPIQIVCGASNVAVGQKVPVATIGTKL
jgi:phenylalanyl-tRNA synthetase beta chain